jgi:hypothetical protein
VNFSGIDEEVIAQLLHRLEGHQISSPWLFRGTEPREILNKVVLEYHEKENKHFTTRAALVKYLFRLCEYRLIDDYRRAIKEVAIEDLPEAAQVCVSKPWLIATVRSIISKAQERDKPILYGWLYQAEGPLQEASSNHDLAADLRKPEGEIIIAKQRIRRLFRRFLGKEGLSHGTPKQESSS